MKRRRKKSKSFNWLSAIFLELAALVGIFSVARPDIAMEFLGDKFSAIAQKQNLQTGDSNLSMTPKLQTSAPEASKQTEKEDEQRKYFVVSEDLSGNGAYRNRLPQGHASNQNGVVGLSIPVYPPMASQRRFSPVLPQVAKQPAYPRQPRY